MTVIARKTPSRADSIRAMRKYKKKGKALGWRMGIYLSGMAAILLYAEYIRPNAALQPLALDLSAPQQTSRRLFEEEESTIECSLDDPNSWTEHALGNCNPQCVPVCIDGVYNKNTKTCDVSSGRRLLSSGGMPIKDPLGLPDDESRHPLVFLHLFGMLYMFIGLAVVCDEFFENSLDGICKALSLSDDVAGATFMAAGSSAPELFTSVMSVFFAENDAGIGTIVGSAVFNVLIIIGMCSFAAPNVKLDWWPLTRDSIFYCISIIALVAFINDQKAELVEGIICLVLYVTYIVIMKFNSKLERYFARVTTHYLNSTPSACQMKFQAFAEHVGFQALIIVVILINLVAIVMEFVTAKSDDPITSIILSLVNYGCAGIFILEMLIKMYGYNFYRYWSVPENAFDGLLVGLIVFELVLQAIAQGQASDDDHKYSGDVTESATEVMSICLSDLEAGGAGGGSSISSLRSLRVVRIMRAARGARMISAARRIKMRQTAPDPEDGEDSTNLKETMKEDVEMETKEKDVEDGDKKAASDDGEVEKKEGEGEDDDDDDDDGPFNPFECPSGESCGSKFYWAFSLPMQILLFFTIPDCRRPMWEKWYLLTFFMSIFWIMVLSFFMVWWAEIFGEVFGIPSAVMGLTILAAGTSVPDTLASVSVARAGKGNMAVSNSIGSNVFDILIGLGLPWFIKGCMGETAKISSDSIVISIMILFITVGMVVLSIHFSGFRLTKKVGYLLLCSYVGYVGLALAMEFKPNAFGLCSYTCPY